VRGHWCGIDSAGRDVFARVLYGLRTSLTFGLLLVAASMALGIAFGARGSGWPLVMYYTGSRTR
jgi:microcin C transport system permease protein